MSETLTLILESGDSKLTASISNEDALNAEYAADWIADALTAVGFSEAAKALKEQR